MTPSSSEINPQVHRIEETHNVQHQGSVAAAAAGAPSTSIWQQMTDLIACRPDWLLLSSCSGCLGQVKKRRAQRSPGGITSLLDKDNDESTVQSGDDGSLIKSDRSYRLTSIPKNDNEGIETSLDDNRPADHSTLNMVISESAANPPPRLKNRSGTLIHVHRKRIDDMIEKIQSTPTPLSVRDQVLEFHGQRQQMTASYSDDYFSESSPTLDVHVMQPLSSTISFPIFTRLIVSSPSESIRHQSSLALQLSPQVLATSSRHRRTKSLPTQPSLPRHISLRSVFDESTYFEGTLRLSENPKLNQPHPKNPHDVSAVCLEGISFGDGDGFFSAAIDLDWCCYRTLDKSADTHNVSSEERGTSAKVKSSNGCGGYIDYGGKNHPCTQESECQGCIFRRGMHLVSQHEYDKEKEEMYYDSDPEQHFAIGVTPSSPLLYTSEQEPMQVSASENAGNIRQRAKRSWSRRQKSQRQMQPNHCCPASLDSSQDSNACAVYHQVTHESKQENNLRQQDDQQVYLYNYLSRNDDAADALQTGICSTNVMDVKNYVQNALNSKWRLLWHVNNTTKLCDVWIERAYRYNRTEVVEPKLMWRESSQPNLKEQRLLGETTIHPYRISLFALRRILTVANGSGSGEVIRHSPVTKPNSLLLIRSSLREDYTFEASCAEERDHIAHLLKMATARLVSHAVAGNGDLMIKEYFNEGHISEHPIDHA
ncbi:hypothetical protein ACHAW5_005117 [Stephanodiscus triporus]|uniref:Uncharacterized protein n=1 Tax=Stephanodiscus triporus TaxID=2934178 RepID=A0ABD3MR01_9STRA